jgi:NhaP-type Na+/H+ or K+/H+ antiporter
MTKPLESFKGGVYGRGEIRISVAIAGGGALIFLAHLFAAIFEKKRIPDVLPLIGLGLILGPVFHLVDTDSFGVIGNVLTTLTLVILLFESGLGLNFSALQQALGNAIRLTATGFLATLAAVAALSSFVLKLPVLDSLLLGSILAGISPAVSIPLLSKLNIKEPFRTTLLLEPTLSDVLTIVISLAILEALRSHQIDPGLMLGNIVSSFAVAILLGVGFAFVWSSILSRVRHLENSLFTTPAFAAIIYGIAQFLGYSGPIAVFAFGIILGNITQVTPIMKRFRPSIQPIGLNGLEIVFLNNIVFLLKALFFVYLGLSVNLSDSALVIAGVMLTACIFVVRIPAVLLSVNKDVGRYEVSLASIMVAKGLAAAALAVRPEQVGIASGYLIKTVVYDVVLASILLTATLTFLIEKGVLNSIYSFLFQSYANDQPAAIVES